MADQVQGLVLITTLRYIHVATLYLLVILVSIVTVGIVRRLNRFGRYFFFFTGNDHLFFIYPVLLIENLLGLLIEGLVAHRRAFFTLYILIFPIVLYDKKSVIDIFEAINLLAANDAFITLNSIDKPIFIGKFLTTG